MRANLLRKVRNGDCDYDLIEVMTCPGGCIGGAGQPITLDPEAKRKRTRGLYDSDKMLELHKSQDNYHVTECSIIGIWAMLEEIRRIICCILVTTAESA